MSLVTTLAALALSCAGLALITAGCGKKQEVPEPVAMDQAEHERWEIALVEYRIEKNEAFQAEDSPLPASQRDRFVGLNYYYPERSLRFRVPFVAAAKTDTVELVKRDGKRVPYLRRGTVTVGHNGKPYTLAVLGPVDPAEGDSMWLPFYDATNGDTTYAGGRYLDLELASDGTVEVDFNYAYNPLCAYDARRYSCTLPPDENRLPFAVAGGELNWRADD
jgi:uncharacterized protein (DUF1684 family)